MSKKVISALIAIVLTVVIVSPMLVAVVDNTIEIGLYENSEEEKDTRGENKVEIEKLLTNSSLRVFSSELIDTANNLGYSAKWYPLPYLNLISPPPELV